MKAIHITESNENGYEIVDVIKKPISSNNGFAYIQHKDGSISFTGGMLIDVSRATTFMLDLLTPKEQYDWIKSIKNPDVSYVNDQETQEELEQNLEITKMLKAGLVDEAKESFKEFGASRLMYVHTRLKSLIHSDRSMEISKSDKNIMDLKVEIIEEIINALG